MFLTEQLGIVINSSFFSRGKKMKESRYKVVEWLSKKKNQELYFVYIVSEILIRYPNGNKST